MSGTGDEIGVVGPTSGSGDVLEASGGTGEDGGTGEGVIARVDNAMSGMALEVVNVEGGSSDCVGVCILLLEDVCRRGGFFNSGRGFLSRLIKSSSIS